MSSESAALSRALRLVLQSQAPRLGLRLLVVATLVVLGPLAGVVAPVVLGAGVDVLVAEQRPLGLHSAFLVYAAVYTAVALLSGVAAPIRDAVFAGVLERAMARAQRDAFAHVLGLSIDFHHARRLGALVQQIERGVRAIEVSIRGAVFQLGTTLLELSLALAVMAYRLAWQFSLIALGGAMLYVLTLRRSSRTRLAARRQQNERASEAASLATDALVHQQTIKLFAAERHVMRRYGAALDAYVSAAVAMGIATGRDSTVQHTVMRSTLAVVITLAGASIASGTLGVGELFTGLLLIKSLFSPLGTLGQTYRELQQAALDMEQLGALRAQAPRIRDSEAPRPLVHALEQGAEVSVECVHYRHESQGHAALSDISFTAYPGQTVALVGASGAGKTTLLHLLARLLDPQHGRIAIDGTDIRHVSLAALHGAIAVVPQDVALFNDTLLMNLTLGKPEASVAQARAAAEAAELGPLLARLPEDLHTTVGERGVKLSGGERQRVGIARALLTTPRVLLLDEATSALDGLTEAQIQATLQRVKAGRTTITVAHRLSTIASADQILVLDHGRIIERGTHPELLALHGTYAELWTHQIKAHPLTITAPRSHFAS